MTALTSETAPLFLYLSSSAENAGGGVQVANDSIRPHQGTITDPTDLDTLVEGVDAVVSMLGEAQLQRASRINTASVDKLVPAMRRRGVAG